MSVRWAVHDGDCRRVLGTLAGECVNTVVTSPPYFGHRDYDHPDQIGQEPAPEEFVEAMVEVFREVRRVLRDDGTVWLNLGDTFADRANKRSDGESRRADRADVVPAKKNTVGNGRKAKDLIGIPWMVAFALRADGWYLRSDIIWAKPNGLPESVTDRPSSTHEHIFLLSKRARYYYDADSIRVPHTPESIARAQRARSNAHKYADGGPANQTLAKDMRRALHPKGRNRPDVWTVPVASYSGAHFATFPPELIEPCVRAGAPEGGLVLDPFAGAGTTGMVALRQGRSFVGVEVNPETAEQARQRIEEDGPLFNRDARDDRLALG